MEVYISINGVLRNLIQKFEYHYNNNFLDAEIEVEEGVIPFNYGIAYPIKNFGSFDSFKFQSKEELNNFLYVDYPLEIFGHSTLSYPGAMMDLNQLMHENPSVNFTLVGIDEFGKARPSTLFFLSRNGCLGNNIRFISSKDIDGEWEKCDVWVTDDRTIIKKCPTNKKAVKFTTDYNQYFFHYAEINNIKKIEELCLKSWVKPITSTLTKLLNNVGQFITRLKR